MKTYLKLAFGATLVIALAGVSGCQTAEQGPDGAPPPQQGQTAPQQAPQQQQPQTAPQPMP